MEWSYSWDFFLERINSLANPIRIRWSSYIRSIDKLGIIPFFRLSFVYFWIKKLHLAANNIQIGFQTFNKLSVSIENPLFSSSFVCQLEVYLDEHLVCSPISVARERRTFSVVY